MGVNNIRLKFPDFTHHRDEIPQITFHTFTLHRKVLTHHPRFLKRLHLIGNKRSNATGVFTAEDEDFHQG